MASFMSVKYWVHMFNLLDTVVKEIQECISYNILYSVQRSDVSLMYRVIHKSLRDFRTRLRNNQERHARKEHINR